MRALDSSVLVPALLTWHAAHNAVQPVIAGAAIPSHVLMETYSVLTRLPRPLTAADAGALVAARAAGEILFASDQLLRTVVERCAETGIVGGGVYDALIALIVVEHDGVLVTRDRRASRTYAMVGASTEWVGS